MWQVQLLLAVIGAGLGESILRSDDKCTLKPTRIPNTSFGSYQYELQVPPTCDKGTVNWPFPTGTVRMRLTRQGASFSLCLETNAGPQIGKLKIVVDGKETEIPKPTGARKSCTESRVGKAELLIYAEGEKMVLSLFDFVVIPGKVG